MEIIIEPCLYADLEPYVVQARRARIGFTPNSTDFFCARQNNEIIGFCGIAFHKDYAVFKNVYVLPDWRSKGVFDLFMQYRLEIARERKLSRVKAYCTPMSVHTWIRYGAKIEKQYANSTTMCIELEYNE